MLLGSGCTVEIEQALGSRGKNPDFLVTQGDEQFVIEAIWTTQRVGDITHSVLTPSLIDAIDSVPSPDFFLSVLINKSGSVAPPLKRLKAGLTRWLADLDPDRVLADQDQHNVALPTHTWQETGWSISFQAIPRSPDRRGIPSSKTAVMYPEMAWLSGRSDLVFNAVKKKGKKYGELSLPFIVAVGHATPFPEDEDIEASLYGSAVEYTRPGSASTFSRLPDGYWTTPHNDGHGRVSGVLIANNPGPWNWAKKTPVLWQSPDPNSIKAPVLPTWATVQVADEQIERQSPAAPAHTAVRLTEQWPTGDPFPRHANGG
ncbi:hypothetical protein [Actinophytocola glycyrrhizae]|uniref:Uncharacterized protein n=1 Tax=Actinophytocola glycyrrhizae TaxID=2044873 RepID=A0ABV9SH65_9PSEU